MLAEADFGHQPGERFVGQAERGDERAVDGIERRFRARLVRGAGLVGEGGEAVGEIDPQPMIAEPAIGERGAEAVGVGGEDRGAGAGERGHRLPAAHRDQRGAPALRFGFHQARGVDVERAEADLQFVQRRAHRAVELADRFGQRLAREQAAGIGEHGGQGADRRAVVAVGRGGGQAREIAEVALHLPFEPALHVGAKLGPGRGRQAVERADGAQRGLGQAAAGREAGEKVAVGGDADVAAGRREEGEAGVFAGTQVAGAAVELVAQAAFGGGEEQALVGEAGGRIDLEVEAGEVADRLGARR